MKITEILKKIYPFNYSLVSRDNIKSIPTYKKFLNFKVHSFKSGEQINGWKVPNEWRNIKGNIYKNNKLIFKADKIFGVPVNSKSFKGKVTFKKLLDHINVSNKLSNAIPYNWTGLYREKKNYWGFCMTKKQLNKLPKSNYFVDIKTSEKKSSMKILDFVLKGKSDQTIIINAHNCHPYQANDDMSGCAVGISLLKKLSRTKDRFFTYRLLISPEITGTVFWLNKFKEQSNNFKYCILLKSVGNKNYIKLQKSFQGDTDIDNIASELIKKQFKKFKVGKFREIYGNDETVFNSPGFDIPSISITRVPFKEYHTNQDKLNLINEKRLKEVENFTFKIINSLEKKKKKLTYLNVNFKGLICLSNKKYNLYLNAIAPGIDKKRYTGLDRNWNLMMNNLPNDINYNNNSVEEISKKYNLPLNQLKKYIDKWVKKKLLSYI